MAKNSKQNGSRGRGSGFVSPRGRGRGGRGRGRGGPGGNEPTRGGYHNQGPKDPGSSFLQEELDFTIQMYADAPNPQSNQGQRNWGGYSTPRGKQDRGGRFQRGRGNGGFNSPNRNAGRGGGNDTRGTDSSSGRGRGMGRGFPGPGNNIPDFSPRHGRGLGASTNYTPGKNIGPNSTLSDLLFASRPLLRPIKFVRSEFSPFLFQYDQEEILKPSVEETDQVEASHIPTADRVERIFQGESNPFQEDASSSSSSSDEGDEGEEEIEEIDFNDLEKLLASPQRDRNTKTPQNQVKMNHVHHMVEDQLDTEFYQRTSGKEPARYSREPEVSFRTAVMEVKDTAHTMPQQPDDELFFIDTEPARVPMESPMPPTPSEDEEIIVYVAPHPKVRSQVQQHEGPFSTGPALQQLDTSAFKPYKPPAALSLASMSINDSRPTTEIRQADSSALEVTASESPVQGSASGTHEVSLQTPAISSLKFNFSSAFNNSLSPLSSGRKLPDIMPPRVAKKHREAWERKKAKKERKKEKEHGHRRGSFAAYGALLNDARLYDDEDVLVDGTGKDTRWDERRKGDSDIDWGTETSGEEKDDGEDVFVAGTSDKVKGKQKAKEVDMDHGMEVDSELDVEAMKQFVSGLMGNNAGNFTTMDDVRDEKMLRDEDENEIGGARGSSDEDDDEDIEPIMELEEKLLIGESDGDENDLNEDESNDDELDISPKSGFQARLEKLRISARAKRPADDILEGDDDDDDMLERYLTLAEEDDYDDYNDLEDRIQEFIDKNSDIIQGRDKKAKNKLFSAIQNGDFSVMQLARKRKDKPEYLPPELLDQWERDRERKANRKRERQLQKLIDASDPYTKKKGGKKGRKAMLQAASIDPDTINLGPNRIIDLTTLIQQIRRFIANLNGPNSMSLPPASKETRKNVHELALAFGLKSASKGYGDARYTTLTKTSRTGIGRVDEWRIDRIRRSGGRGARGDTFGEFSEGKNGRGVPKHREGDEVGASAPKITEDNVGFKMLAAMGWSEGGRIGLSGGLEAPLVAIIKHSKLGLGATK